MNAVSPKQFGYASRDGYSIDTDLALMTTGFQSNWTRQRRTFMHNASLFTVTYKLTAKKAKQLNDFLQAQPDGEFFLCSLISGNDDTATCAVYEMEIRRTSEISVSRIPLSNYFTVTFSAESKAQTGFEQKSADAAGKSPVAYPSYLPLPSAADYAETHGNRNVTVYDLTYTMNSATLAKWLSFAGYAGTAWFAHPMVSVNVNCGTELVRYISNPIQSLVAPDVFQVSIQCQTMPSTAVLDLVIETVGECTYNGESQYDASDEIYDCDAVAPPQGDFVMPSGVTTIYKAETGISPLTASAVIKFNRDGTVECIPASSPPWAAWHTAPETLLQPAVSANKVIEFSIDNGVSWRFSSPVPAGYWIGLKNNDVWFRYQVTATYTQISELDFNLDFRANQLPTPSLWANASVKMVLDLEIGTGGGGGSGNVVSGAHFFDGYSYEASVGEYFTASAGVSFTTTGGVYAYSSNQLLGDWYSPQEINAGVGLFVLLKKSTGTSNINGQDVTRFALSATKQFIISSRVSNNYAYVSWLGTYEIWNSESGGTMLGSGTIELESEITGNGTIPP